MQQEQQQGEQRQPFAAEKPVGQQGGKEAAGEKEKMGQQVAGQQGVADVVQPQPAFRQQQGQLKGDAVIPVGGMGEPGVLVAADIVQVGGGNIPLDQFVPAHAVVVKHDDAGQGEQGAYRQGPHRQRRPARQHSPAAAADAGHFPAPVRCRCFRRHPSPRHFTAAADCCDSVPAGWPAPSSNSGNQCPPLSLFPPEPELPLPFGIVGCTRHSIIAKTALPPAPDTAVGYRRWARLTFAAAAAYNAGPLGRLPKWIMQL